jgi:hypothetical protein
MEIDLELSRMKNRTQKSNYFTRHFRKLGPAGFCLLATALANDAKADFFKTNIVNNTSYSWDAPNWSTSPNGPFTSSWTPGAFAEFVGGSGDTYTVTVNASESMAGLYMGSGGSATTVVIADAGHGTGSLNIAAGPAQATQNGFSWLTQAFDNNPGVFSITAPMTGAGGVEEESGGGGTGHLQFFGNNSYLGGTLFTSSTTFNDYNNNNSFGATSSQIGFDATTFTIMENDGPSTVNIANPVQIIGTGTGVDFIGNSSTFSGNWYLGGGSTAVNIRNNGVGTTLTLSGVLSSTTGAVTYSGANAGTILLSGVNTYTGNTVVGSAGDTAITVQLGAANAIAQSGSVVLAGGTLTAGGFNQANTGTLGLTASSSLLFGATGTTALSFANSTGLTWSGTLDLADWQGNAVADGGSSTDTLEVGLNQFGLTPAQLADIEFDNNPATKGSAGLDPNGYVEELPEPSTVTLGVIGGLALVANIRRRMA